MDAPETKRQKIEESPSAQEEGASAAQGQPQKKTWEMRAAKSGLTFGDDWDVPSLPALEEMESTLYYVRVILLTPDASVKCGNVIFSCEEYARRMHEFLSRARKVDSDLPAEFCNTWRNLDQGDLEIELAAEDEDGDYMRGSYYAKFRDYFHHLEEQRKIEPGVWSGFKHLMVDSFGDLFVWTKKDPRFDAEWMVGPLDE